MDNPFKSPTLLSLCTGMRGLERGIERAIGSVRTVAYVEIEAFVIENLVHQMEQGVLATAPIWSNVKTFPAEQFYGKIHGITGGYPCQPFSNAGKRRGKEDPRHLWPYIKSMVGTIQPVWCFFENVPGHLTLGYREVRSELEQLGYKVEEGIFSAEEVGAPQLRKRLFILAIRNKVGNSGRIEPWLKEFRFSQRYREQSNKEDFLSDSRDRLTDSGVKMVNANHNGYDGTENRKGIDSRNDRSTSQQDNVEQSSRSSSEQLADSIGKGLERRKEQPTWKEQPTTKRSSRVDRWPARPGEPQYEWEAPRIESSMGYAINGYNFREDLLRMAGNGVVEQTAELAFRELLKKHGLTLNPK